MMTPADDVWRALKAPAPAYYKLYIAPDVMIAGCHLSAREESAAQCDDRRPVDRPSRWNAAFMAAALPEERSR